MIRSSTRNRCSKDGHRNEVYIVDQGTKEMEQGQHRQGQRERLAVIAEGIGFRETQQEARPSTNSPGGRTT